MGRACRTNRVGIEPTNRVVPSRYSGSQEHVSVRLEPREVGRRQMHRHQGEDQVHPVEPGKRKLQRNEKTRTDRCYLPSYRLGPSYSASMCTDADVADGDSVCSRERDQRRSLRIWDRGCTSGLALSKDLEKVAGISRDSFVKRYCCVEWELPMNLTRLNNILTRQPWILFN